MKSAETTAPRLVMYQTQGTIVVAKVVAGGIRVNIPKPCTVCKALKTLLASYYVWNVQYPPGHELTLAYLDSEILKSGAKKASLKKFIRDVNFHANPSSAG